MRIKKEFLNIETLKPYGFKKHVVSDDCPELVEYKYKSTFCTILIQRVHGDISIVFNCNFTNSDTVNIPNVVYELITDGLVEVQV